MQSSRAGWVMVAVGLFASMACGGSDPDVGAEREKWRELRPAQYVIQTCGTGFGSQGCGVQAVDGDSEPGPVEDMFDAVDESECDVTKLSFDPTYRFITEYYLDCGEEGYGAVVSCFRPDTLDTSACGSD